MDSPYVISIIANFYKSTRYIPTLLKSIANQTYPHWKLVCIDDCSPDNDYLLIYKLAKKFGIEDKVTVIRNQTNLGISCAKEVGILNADGDYVTFIDGDDKFTPDALQKLITAAVHYDTELVVAGNYVHYNILGLKKDVINKSISDNFINRLILQDEIKEHLLINYFGVNIFNPAYWAKLYKKDLLKRLKFNFPSKAESALEDHKFTLEVIRTTQNVVFIDDIVYYWRWGGITTLSNVEDWSATKFLTVTNDYYIQRKAIVDNGFAKGYMTLMAELKNTFRESIVKIAVKSPKSNKISEQLSFISKCVNHPAYDDLKDLPELNEIYRHEPIVGLLINKDIRGIYEYCHALNRQRRFRNFLRGIITRLRMV